MRLNVNEINALPRDKRFKYLREAEKALIKVKKSSDIESHEVAAPYQIISKLDSKSISKDVGFIAPDISSIYVKVVANTSYYIDSQLDMIIKGAVSKSIQERKGFIPFLHDHLRSLDARIADVKNIYEDEVSLMDLGFNKEGSTWSLIFEALVQKEYNEKIFNQYKNGQVNQHSIGLRYMDLVLAMNDENSPDQLKNWNEFYPMAINPEKADEFGYFWVVKEYKLIENSAVLFGANDLTPTLQTRSDTITLDEAVIETPQDIEPPKKALNYDYILQNFKI